MSSQQLIFCGAGLAILACGIAISATKRLPCQAKARPRCDAALSSSDPSAQVGQAKVRV